MNIEKVDILKYGFSILQIETISLCNMQCEFCGYPLRRDKNSILPEEIVLSIIDSLYVAEGFKHVCLSQFNEPLLDKRIYTFIKYAKEHKVPVMIVTNGLLFNSKEIISRLVDACPDYIKVSLQVLNQELFSRVRKPGGNFQSYKQGIFEFLKTINHGPSEVTVDIACNFLSGKGRLKWFFGLEYGDPSVYNTVTDLKVDTKNFLKELEDRLPSYKYDDAIIDDYLMDVSSNYPSEPGLKIGKNILLKIKPFIYGRRIKEFHPFRKAKSCGSKILGILSSGSVVPCCMAYDDAPFLGNVRKDTLRFILERNLGLLKDMRSGKAKTLPLTCQHCLGAPTKHGAMLKNIRYAFR